MMDWIRVVVMEIYWVLWFGRVGLEGMYFFKRLGCRGGVEGCKG